ncbi:dynamin family protein [Helicobacter ibis]|uniref:Dynamin family protein n=1 Tax=Helicobacter ibis TaxID=2962633 RepID=A0ABT4VDC7_9HELI|nr:dynamin family protein [Helicobacter ibis]MDA3968163.1 dynamin family protein [Helicobacter ibis]
MLEQYIQECNEILNKLKEKSPTQKLIMNLSNNLDTNDYSLSFINSLQNKSKEPMQIAIIGQFSSGKSTFLNSLLGQKILPTGITPITSKVCKICYGEEYILEVIYKDGRKVLQHVDFLQKQTREESKEIDHFCLYAPILFLKEINFLDTPGFNSQNIDDTQTTSKILENIDGIIWLTLIDNAGKNSEKILLKNTIKNYAQKSLCVLNQKDRLHSQKDIDTSVEYAIGTFGDIFKKIIPISAKMALDARLNSDTKIYQTSLITMTQKIQTINPTQESIEQIRELLTQEETKINEALKKLQDNENLMEQSGMPLIFDFLDTYIKPKASISKEYSAIKKFKEMHVLLNLQYHKLKMCYINLEKILKEHMQNTKENINITQEKEQKIFNDLYIGLDALLDLLAQKIYNSLTTKNIEIQTIQKGIISNKIQIQIKEVTILPKEQLQITLTNEDSQLYKNFKSLSLQIKNFCELFSKSINNYSKELQKNIEQWKNNEIKRQEIYAIAKDNKTLKDLEEFSMAYYKNLLTPYFKNDLEIISYLNSELTFLSNFISINYNNIITLSLSKIDLKITNSIDKHKENQSEFALFTPTLENIRDTLNEGFCFEQFQARLFGPMNLLKKTNSKFISQLEVITKQNMQIISVNKENINKQIDTIKGNLKEIMEFQNMELKLL